MEPIKFKLLVILALVSLDSAQDLLQEKRNRICPTWYLVSSLGGCECGSDLGGVILCESRKRVELQASSCMTYQKSRDVVMVGLCPYARDINDSQAVDRMYIPQPKDSKSLNSFTCGWLNRNGLLCSHCDNSSKGVAVLSYSYECTECLGILRGWLLYFTLALTPLTVFFLIVIFCNFYATEAHMNAVICCSQLVLYGINTHPGLSVYKHRSLTLFLITIAGTWNLDFFRYVYPPFCISNHYSTLQVLSFEYIIAFYPLMLIILTYISIELYDKDYKLLVLMWKPFKKCLACIQKYSSLHFEDAKSGIINAFTTYFILSYSKILYTSHALISHTQISENDGSLLVAQNTTQFTLYNASVPYLGEEHKPYFILAVLVLIVFNILPMVLFFVYPIKIFQKLLGCFPRVRWDYLHIFMDYFQGCFKNGTNNTLDYRCFAGVYLLIRFLNLTSGFIRNTLHVKVVNFLSLLMATILFGTFRPYKIDFYNRSATLCFALLSIGHFRYMSGLFMTHSLPFTVLGAFVCAFLILIFYLYIFMRKCFPQKLSRLRN